MTARPYRHDPERVGARATGDRRACRANARAFTLVEAMLASALLGVVGAAVAALLSAFAGGTSARAHIVSTFEQPHRRRHVSKAASIGVNCVSNLLAMQ